MAKNEMLYEIKKVEEDVKKMIGDRSLRGGSHD